MTDEFRLMEYKYANESICNIMLLLTNCEVHTAKYLDGSFDGPLRKIRSENFPYGTNNWLMRALLYSHHEIVTKFRRVVGRFSEN